MTKLVLPFQRASGAAVFAALRGDAVLTLAFTDVDDIEQDVPRIAANWQAFAMFDGPTPQLLYSENINLRAELPAVTIRKVWLLNANGAVLTAANLRSDVTAGDSVEWTIAGDTILFTLSGT